MTSMGKFRHLSRASTADGHFLIMAIDHRINLLDQLNEFASTPLTDNEFTAFKQTVIQAAAPYTSAILTDPAYGMAEGIISQNLHGQMGLLAPLEVTNYDLHPSEREMQCIPHWSVKKIKMVGGDGVKLLLPYHPEADNVQAKHDFVQHIIEDCTTYDIPFYLEPIPYALNPQQKLSNAELLQISVEMCETFSAMGVDILKLSFPVDPQQSTDETEWLQACEAIDQACTVPWALLSGGVDFDTFLRQSEIACQAGASGVIVGRAVWAEAIELQGIARSQFLTQTAPQRLQALAEVCANYAHAWHTQIQIPTATTNWYESYQA